MSNKKQLQMFAFFAIATTLLALVGLAFVLYFAFTSPDSFDTYPSYTYSQYVNRSDEAEITPEAGAQMIEAESFSLTGQANRKENIAASNQEEVIGLSKSSSLSYRFSSPSSYTVKVTIAISFLSDNGREIDASSLFNLSLNGATVSLEGIKISPCYNEMEFLENDIGIAPLDAGLNLLELISLSNDSYGIDYFVLTPQQERDNTKLFSTIGSNYTYTFLANSGKQRFEAELGEREKTLLIEDANASNFTLAYFSEAGDKLTFHLNSSAQVSTSFVLALAKRSEEDEETSLCVKVNGTEAKPEKELKLSSAIQEFSFGNISLRRDENTLVIEDLKGRFTMDYFLLNADFNYSPLKENNVYEAEGAFLTGAQIVSETGASKKKAVRANGPYATLEFDLSAPLKDQTYFSLRIGYQGEARPLSDLFEVSLDGTALTLSNSTVRKSEAYAYQDIALGSLELKRGRNVLLFRINAGSDINLSIDILTLYYPSLGSNTSLYFEAENVLPVEDSRIVYSKKASGESAVLLHQDSLRFLFLSKRKTTLNLTLSLCFLSGGTNLSDCLSMEVNGVAFPFLDGAKPEGSEERNYAQLNLGNFSVREGLNVLEVKAQDASFLLDLLILHE